MEGLAEIEKRQFEILRRISELEQHQISIPTHEEEEENSTVSCLSSILKTNGVDDFSFKRVSSDYYDKPLEFRRDVLDAASIHHLCKSIVLVNTQAHASVTDCSNRNNSKYYVVVVQYSARFNAETVKKFLYSINKGKIPKNKFNYKPYKSLIVILTYHEDTFLLRNRRYHKEVILNEAITKLNPDYFWLGGGEIDLKLGIRTSEFINFVKPFIVSCSSST